MAPKRRLVKIGDEFKSGGLDEGIDLLDYPAFTRGLPKGQVNEQPMDRSLVFGWAENVQSRSLRRCPRWGKDCVDEIRGFAVDRLLSISAGRELRAAVGFDHQPLA